MANKDTVVRGAQRNDKLKVYFTEIQHNYNYKRFCKLIDMCSVYSEVQVKPDCSQTESYVHIPDRYNAKQSAI